MQLPLDGIFVADFTRVLAGPLCTQMLGDEGARVVKIEEPRHGDETRLWGPPFAGDIATYFLSVNRNKESIALDLGSSEGAAIARALIARADVVIDNFLPRQRESLGLGNVTEVNPRAVHCSIGGYDSDTPDANTPGYDLLAQAGSGLMSITGEVDRDPVKSGVALSDVLTAHYAHGAICAALYARERTGRGSRLEISIFGATLASLVNVAQAALTTNHEATRFGNAHPSIVPYQVFHASDRTFAVGGGTDRHFMMLCERVLERPDLAHDERFATNTQRVVNRDALVTTLDDAFRQLTAEHWIERCRAAAIPVSLVQGVLEALQSDAGRQLAVTVDHSTIGPYKTVSNPVKWDGQRLPVRSAPPNLGEHTTSITAEITRKK